MVRIAVASGKGGTGKTSVAVILSQILSRQGARAIDLCDCDVEEPNVRLFYPDALIRSETVVNQSVARINTDACTYCRKCIEFCEFNAIIVLPEAEFAEVNTSLCHACGACLYACPEEAINEEPSETGTITHLFHEPSTHIIEGRLKIGSAMQTAVIRELKKETASSDHLVIYDAPPGTTCPVVQTVAGTDFVILVTEPTPFGLSDLKLSIELLENMHLPFGVIINRSDIGEDHMERYLRENDYLLLGSLPFERAFAERYAEGNLLENLPASMESRFTLIAENVMKAIKRYE
jgi:MinD superfamily P-loop ATPase